MAYVSTCVFQRSSIDKYRYFSHHYDEYPIIILRPARVHLLVCRRKKWWTRCILVEMQKYCVLHHSALWLFDRIRMRSRSSSKASICRCLVRFVRICLCLFTFIRECLLSVDVVLQHLYTTYHLEIYTACVTMNSLSIDVRIFTIRNVVTLTA